jgi:hypothetical protein
MSAYICPSLTTEVVKPLAKKRIVPPNPPDYPPPVPLPKGEARGINILFTGGFKE